MCKLIAFRCDPSSTSTVVGAHCCLLAQGCIGKVPARLQLRCSGPKGMGKGVSKVSEGGGMFRQRYCYWWSCQEGNVTTEPGGRWTKTRCGLNNLMKEWGVAWIHKTLAKQLRMSKQFSFMQIWHRYKNNFSESSTRDPWQERRFSCQLSELEQKYAASSSHHRLSFQFPNATPIKIIKSSNVIDCHQNHRSSFLWVDVSPRSQVYICNLVGWDPL